jgi:hypothetical protein
MIGLSLLQLPGSRGDTLGMMILDSVSNLIENKWDTWAFF